MTESINHVTTAWNLSYGKKGVGIHLIFHHYCHILKRRKERNLRTGLHWTWRQKFVSSTSLDSPTLQHLPETTRNMIHPISRNQTKSQRFQKLPETNHSEASPSAFVSRFCFRKCSQCFHRTKSPSVSNHLSDKTPNLLAFNHGTSQGF